MKRKLTQDTVNTIALPRGKAEEIFFDTDRQAPPGFGLRVRAGGSRKYVLHYRIGGIQRRYTIGLASAYTLREARQKANAVLVAVDHGKDPAAEKATKRAASSLIFSAVVEDYLAARQRDMKPRSLIECSRHLRRLWKPLHGLALGAVSRPMIASHLRKMADENGPVAANRARATLSAMYGWAIGEGLCETNPVDGTNTAPEAGARERVLSDAELAAIWNAAPDNDYGRIVRLLMLTGQRRNEMAELRWPEYRQDERMLTLPPERTKNGRSHDMALADSAVAVLEACSRHAGREYVFGSGAGGFSGWSRAKIALDRASGVTAWTLHDLRRTAATRMADLGVLPHVIEAVLNHISGHKAGVAGIYNRSTYAAEKRAALELWARHIQLALAQADGTNVVALR